VLSNITGMCIGLPNYMQTPKKVSTNLSNRFLNAILYGSSHAEYTLIAVYVLNV